MDVLHDIRFALRSLKKGFLVTLLCIISLAFAILGNVTVFSIINGLFLRPVPFFEPTRLVMVGEKYPGDTSVVQTAAEANFLDWQEQSQAFSSLAAFARRSLNLGSGTESEAISSAAVTPSFFAVLGRQALHGRTFDAEDGRQAQQRVVVLNNDFWQERYGGDPSIVGKDLRIDDELYSVIGVLPADFEFMAPNVRLWVPMILNRENAKRSEKAILVVGRLADGVSMESARGEMKALGDRLTQLYPEANQGYDLTLLNMREDIPDARNKQVFALMQGAMFFVLLIACANIANLLLARAEHRRGEIALRSVLGAGRGRIIRQLITESLVLALIGGVIGLALAAVGVRVITSAMAGALPAFFAPVIDLRVILFFLLITSLAGLTFGLMPALSVRPELASALKEQGGRSGSGGRRMLGRVFVVAEIAAALILLAGAGMLTEGFLKIQTADPGFDTDNLMAASISLPQARYAEDSTTSAFYTDLLTQIEATPGVVAAGTMSNIPRSPIQPRAQFSIEGSPLTDGEQLPRSIWIVTSDGYARTLGLQVRQGRFFDRTDREDSLPVAVISASLAKRYFPDQDPIGRNLTILENTRRIIGVLPDIRQEVTLGSEGSDLAVYLPIQQHPSQQMVVMLRTTEGAPSVAETLGEEVRTIDPLLPQPQLLTLEAFQARFFAGAQIFTVLLGGFGTLALFLAALGTYGIIAYSVARRTNEIGLRMALGARPLQVVWLVTLQGLKMAFIGVLVGVPGIFLLGKAVTSVMDGISTISPVSLAIAVGVLGVSILLACILPALRASRVDPTNALRVT